MYHPRLSRLKLIRIAMMPVAFVCVMMSGCADQQLTEPLAASVVHVTDVPFNKFFVAWSQTYGTGTLQTQQFALDARQDRQYVDWWVNQEVLSFASANKGRLYIDGDEPDQQCYAPADYAVIYHDFVTAVRSADPTARVSPAGFAEPNYHCCPPPGVEPCISNMHSIGYAQQFYDAYARMYGAAPPVSEWRFHDFGTSFAVGDVDGWWGRVEKDVDWSVAHGANMVLGTWGFTNWPESDAAFQENMKIAMGRILSDNRIVSAVYWSYQPWVYSPRYLVNTDGSLTSTGQFFLNPLSDVPASVKIVGSADGHAKLRWNNTTSAWGAEAEFWVQPAGSSTFTYRSTSFVSAAGSEQTPFMDFNAGDNVKGRVRYYNAFGKGDWTPFSNVVVLSLTDKRPLSCFLKLC
jgi:hypothetical protein